MNEAGVSRYHETRTILISECKILQAIDDLRVEGIHHFIDVLYYDAYLALRNIQPNNAMLYLQQARDWAEDMVGADDERVVQMIERLPADLR